MLTLLVPRGAEAAAVRRAAPGAEIVEIAAGAAAGSVSTAIGPGAFAVVVGLCGSLGAARVGDVVAYERIVDPSGTIAVDAAALARVDGLLPGTARATAWTAERVVTEAAERATIAARTGATVVDMEAAPLARALSARGVGFAMVRVVSDDPRFDLPPIGDALDPSGSIRPLALATAFARRPVAAARFVRDVQASLRVLGSVAAALGASVAAK